MRAFPLLLYSTWKESNCAWFAKYGVCTKGIRYCPKRHFHVFGCGYMAVHAGGMRRPGLTKAATCSVSSARDSTEASAGASSIQMPLSSIPRTSTPGSTAATLSRCAITPRAPALHPPKSRRVPLPRPRLRCRSCTAAFTIACPRNWRPNASVSPNQASELQ